MPTLCFGGSFNPIHHGHLLCARHVAESKGFDRVLLIPSAQPPHKAETATLATPQQRLAMCRLATEAESGFGVDDIEIHRTGPSYTIDTARELTRRGLGPVYWLLGADMLMQLPTWHQPLELLREVRFLPIARPGWTIDWSRLPTAYQTLRGNVVEAPLLQISATDIRHRVAAGQSISYLTPPDVCHYIYDRLLYRIPK